MFLLSKLNFFYVADFIFVNGNGRTVCLPCAKSHVGEENAPQLDSRRQTFYTPRKRSHSRRTLLMLGAFEVNHVTLACSDVAASWFVVYRISPNYFPWRVIFKRRLGCRIIRGRKIIRRFGIIIGNTVIYTFECERLRFEKKQRHGCIPVNSHRILRILVKGAKVNSIAA